MTAGPPNLDDALRSATDLLMSRRNERGHWRGSLSSSALSTATAAFALHMCDAQGHEPVIRQACQWLASHQNGDGGWGDTPVSSSNLSTTALAWAGLAAVDPQGQEPAISRARQWLLGEVPALTPKALAGAVASRYGQDKTFSAPILSMLALAGQLDPPPQSPGRSARWMRRMAWQHVPALPFGLAAMPHRLLKFLRLPVVSYALPALIAIGHGRFWHRRPRLPIRRIIRRMLVRRTLRLLSRSQPPSGGFLEAAPLTSFVLMNLVGCYGVQGACRRWGLRYRAVPAMKKCEAFLLDTVRADGSWPIDTDLATWVTTLSVSALAGGGTLTGGQSSIDPGPIRDWLLNQQLTVEHPYTHAPAGGWAWTDLPGGVPDGDDTAGALVALARVSGDADEASATAAQAGIRWLLGLQNHDGGTPTFCRGWGRLPFDRSSADITAHVLSAFSCWRGRVDERLGARMDGAAGAAMGYLQSVQRLDGSFVPLWFGNERARGEENRVYGTGRVAMGLAPYLDDAAAAQMAMAAGSFLVSSQRRDSGWGADATTPASIEETAVAVDALGCLLAACLGRPGWEELAVSMRTAVAGGAAWLIAATQGGRHFRPAPIGLYFAKLWYFEELYPLIFTVSALSRARDVLGPVGR